MFAGTVKRMAAKKNIPTPANDLLYDKIKAIEALY
jgi:ketopantoate reductase